MNSWIHSLWNIIHFYNFYCSICSDVAIESPFRMPPKPFATTASSLTTPLLPSIWSLFIACQGRQCRKGSFLSELWKGLGLGPTKTKWEWTMGNALCPYVMFMGLKTNNSPNYVQSKNKKKMFKVHFDLPLTQYYNSITTSENPWLLLLDTSIWKTKSEG